MERADVVNDLNELSMKCRLVSDLATIAVWLLDDPLYSKEEAAGALIKIITDLDAGTPVIPDCIELIEKPSA